MRQSVAMARNLDICTAALRRTQRRSARETWVSPIITKHPEGSYTRVILRCPRCRQALATYKTGQTWCENGLAQSELHNCPECYQKIDYRNIPITNHKFGK